MTEITNRFQDSNTRNRFDPLGALLNKDGKTKLLEGGRF